MKKKKPIGYIQWQRAKHGALSLHLFTGIQREWVCVLRVWSLKNLYANCYSAGSAELIISVGNSENSRYQGSKNPYREGKKLLDGFEFKNFFGTNPTITV